MPKNSNSEDGLREALRRDWRALRDRGTADVLCASMATRQWTSDRGDAQLGYVTLDYQIHEGVAAPNGGREPPVLVEHYWSVRTLNGRQDTNWPPALNINVVHLHSGAIRAIHVENALRNTLVFQRTAYRQSWFDDPDRARLHTRAVLIGESVAEDTDIMAGFEQFHGVQLWVGAFTHNAAEGFQFTRPMNQERVWNVGLVSADATRALADELFGRDALPRLDFRWNGVNEGAVYLRPRG